MRTGFEVTIEATGKAEFHLFSPANSLVTFAQDSATEIAVVLMGRIYYQDDWKTRFPQAFSEDFASDAALALAIFQHYGAQGLEKLEGEFALVVFDRKESRLFALRDPLGNFPLYWMHHNQTTRVSTSLQLLAQRLPQAAINKDFLASFLMFPYAFVELATEKTAFEEIQRILPGNILVLTPDGRTTKIWSWDWMKQIQPIENITPQEAGLQFSYLFRQAVTQRIQDEKIASHLSGGMDSSSIVCIARDLLAAETSPRKLITLSLVYQMRSLAGETDYIQMVVDQGGAIEPQYVDGDAVLDFEWFTNKIPTYDEPYPGLFHLAMEKVLVDVAAQLGVTAIMSGGGAELIVEGNRMHLADLMRQGHWHKALQEARQWATAKNQSLWSILYSFGIEPLIPPLLREGFPTFIRGGYGRWPKLGSFTIPPWILPDFAKQHDMWGKALKTIREINRYPVEESLNLLGLRASAGNWAAWYLAAPLGIRICQPFLDPRLIIYCLSLPREQREIPGVPKPLLQVAMDGILPEPIRTRRFKGNFNEVYWQGLAKNLSHLEAMVVQSQIDELGIFDKQQLIQAMRQHAIGIGDVRSGSRISSSLAAIAWFDQIKVKVASL
ncbi:asparagine synthase-related protein [Anabaena subtropica]|uniref:asparagine synthase (glutamine-hydrolyzing) n=1 Tax=Anabaena subtropica FACHB-260 TaxID=2692884 RepID=A0ABR8CPB2_9NOST|nr:asparagine synthase-related protein [Anabaena subtropica]MBD2344398.1 asparagine synthase [Anabaena subtropica FACHB-260]